MSKNIPEKFDFSGYVTKYNVLCDDGRTISSNAFIHHDGTKVALVDSHLNENLENVLGHVYLSHRADGLYGYGVLNETSKGSHAKELIKHGDVDSFSIFANMLKYREGKVSHGTVREVSLVLSGKNPVAKIDNINIQHGGSISVSEEEAIIHGMGSSLEIYDSMKHAAGQESVEDILKTLSPTQLGAVEYLISGIIENLEKIEQSGLNEGDGIMKYNPFEHKQLSKEKQEEAMSILHNGLKESFERAKSSNSSYMEDVIKHAADYGITDISLLFPEAKMAPNGLQYVDKDFDWVDGVLAEVTKTPFANVKSMFADISMDDARAKGYVKGNEKTEEQFSIATRKITPGTVYAKQKIDNDDMLDITDFNAMGMLDNVMNIKLKQELARAYLIGDGRAIDSPDKVKTANIVPIWTDADLYSVKLTMPTLTPMEQLDYMIKMRKNWKGSGRPTLYTTQENLSNWLLIRDDNKRKMYRTKADIAAELNVKDIVDIEIFENQTRVVDANTHTLFAIFANLKDYNVGTNAGGQVKSRQFFDIDFNQHKLLKETRQSGGLIKPYSALVYETVTATPGG